MRQSIKDHGSPRRGKGFESHTKTLTQGGLPPESVESFSYDWRRVWVEVEVPPYEGGSRVVGRFPYEGGSRVVGRSLYEEGSLDVRQILTLVFTYCL